MELAKQSFLCVRYTSLWLVSYTFYVSFCAAKSICFENGVKSLKVGIFQKECRNPEFMVRYECLYKIFIPTAQNITIPL
jgi:hypothetical protein